MSYKKRFRLFVILCAKWKQVLFPFTFDLLASFTEANSGLRVMNRVGHETNK